MKKSFFLLFALALIPIFLGSGAFSQKFEDAKLMSVMEWELL